MKLFGLNISRALPANRNLSPVENSRALPANRNLSPVFENRGGWFRILESFAGAWQRNVEIDFDSVLTFHAVYACVTLIASDISKLRVKLVEDRDGIWTEITNSAYSPVLRKPNSYQNRIQFFENWIISKLLRGNTYILKQRDKRGVVIALYILDPNRVKPLVSEDGAVFYELSADNLSNLVPTIGGTITVPAREIIHDRYNCLFHPLIGISPIFSCGLAAVQGLNIQKNSAKFFENLAVPSGILIAPGAISNETATRLKEHWETNYQKGTGLGKIAVLGDKLEFKPLTMSSVDAQLIEQLKWSAEVVCSTFHVPPYKIGVGAMPAYNNIQALNVEYYSQALQALIEAAELCLDEGLSTGEKIGTEFDLDGLLRMDSVTQMEVVDKGKNTFTPNESRRKLNLPGVEGGDQVYRQQQDFSIAALAKRDAKDDPFASTAPKAPAPKEDEEEIDVEEDEDQTDKLIAAMERKAEGEWNHAEH